MLHIKVTTCLQSTISLAAAYFKTQYIIIILQGFLFPKAPPNAAVKKGFFCPNLEDTTSVSFIGVQSRLLVLVWVRTHNDALVNILVTFKGEEIQVELEQSHLFIRGIPSNSIWIL